jgi:hypothetical protein
MRGLWAILLPTFALGFGVAWWLKPEPAPPESEADRPKVAPRIPGRDAGLQEHVISAATTLDALADLRYQPQDFSGELEAIDVSEIPGLLGSLADRAGYFGLASKDETVLEKLVLHWFDRAPDEALLWVLSLEPEADRDKLLRELVNHEAEEDLDAAIALARRCSGTDGTANNFLGGLQQKAADKGEAKLLELCRLSAGRTDGASGLGLVYPPDFNFRKMLDGLVEISGSLGEGEQIATVPSNLLEEWTRRDPQAAFDWVSQGHEISFNGMEEFIEAYAEIGGDREVGALVGGIFDAAEPHASTRYDLAWEALSEAPRPGTLEGFLETAGAAATREAHLAGLLDRSGAFFGSDYDQARRVIVEGMTPEERRRLISASSLSPELRRKLIPELRRLGHSDAEIAAMTGVEES